MVFGEGSALDKGWCMIDLFCCRRKVDPIEFDSGNHILRILNLSRVMLTCQWKRTVETLIGIALNDMKCILYFSTNSSCSITVRRYDRRVWRKSSISSDVTIHCLAVSKS